MIRQTRAGSLMRLLGSILIANIVLNHALGQSPSRTLPQPPKRISPIKPVSLTHLYWHFLAYQNHLDSRAAEEEARGRDGSPMRNYFQKRLGLSDAEFSSIRVSSSRLMSTIRTFDSQAAAVRVRGASPTTIRELESLTAQRETAINAEQAYLRRSLPQDKVQAFEAFLTRHFSPNNAVSKASGQAVPLGGQ